VETLRLELFDPWWFERNRLLALSGESARIVRRRLNSKTTDLESQCEFLETSDVGDVQQAQMADFRRLTEFENKLMIA
jgi:hypothetical protein